MDFAFRDRGRFGFPFRSGRRRIALLAQLHALRHSFDCVLVFGRCARLIFQQANRSRSADDCHGHHCLRVHVRRCDGPWHRQSCLRRCHAGNGSWHGVCVLACWPGDKPFERHGGVHHHQQRRASLLSYLLRGERGAKRHLGCPRVAFAVCIGVLLVLRA